MSNLFRITEREITTLSNYELRPLLNQLLLAEARSYGIPASYIEVTQEDNISDDGIDVRIEHSVKVPEECRIPTGLSVWQYKAGAATASDIGSESQKTGVQNAIANDGSYCFVVGQSCSDPMRRNREQALDRAFSSAGKLPKRKLFTAAEIAEWVSDYPAIAAQFLKFQSSDDFYTFQQWDELAQSGTRIEFQFNETRQNIINGIADLLISRSESTCIRLIGADGTGKTRLILEALRVLDLSNLTFYAVTPEAVPENFFSFVQARTSINKLVLVVDECDEDNFRSLWSKVRRCNGRVTLVTIGSDETKRTGEVEPGIIIFLLDKLDDGTIRRVIHLAAPLLHPELQLYIARIVDGYVKFATALAESMSVNQGIGSVSELMALPKVQFILRSLVKNDQERDAMYALSSLRFVGLDDDAAIEGQALAKFLNLDFGKLKRISYQMERRGLVIKRGRFRYVTPSLLAVWFARELWEAQGNDLISSLLPQLPSVSTQQRLLQRLGDIGDERFAVPIVEENFGLQSELAKIDALDDEGMAKFFNILANAAPISCTQALERIFWGVSRQRLLEFRKGRRQIIYTLERLLRLKETFYQAARILLKLAAAENETWANNASGIWQEIFYTHLGLSPFPAWERHSLIQEAITPSNTIEERLLGVKAIFHALTHAEFGTYGEGPGGHLPERWRPQIWDDVWRTYRSALGLLDQLLTDVDERVMQEGISTLIGTARILFKTPLKSEILNRLEKQVYNPQLEPKKKTLIDVLDQVLEYEIAALSENEIVIVQKWREDLLGNSYHDRLRRWVGELNWSDRYQVYRDKENSTNLNQILINLAREGHQYPSLIRPELQWLASPEAQMSGLVAFELGILDEEKFWLKDLLPYLPTASYFISNYLMGHSSRGNRDWVEELLGSWVQDHPELAETVFFTIQRLGGSDQYAKWIISLVGKRWLQPEYLGALGSYGWLEHLSEEIFIELLKPLVGKNEAKYTAIALHLITHWIKSHSQHNLTAAQFIVALLERVPYDRATHQNSSMGWYHWQDICIFYLRAFTVKIVAAAAGLMRNWVDAPIGPEDQRIYVLREALKVSPELAWPVIGKALLDTQQEGYYWPSKQVDIPDRETLDTGTLLETIDHTILMGWVEENKPLAPQILAEHIRVEQTPLPTLARELIINYGDDDIVAGHLHPRARGMTWSGSYTGRLQEMLDVVRSWLNDENEAVRRWATDIAQDIEGTIRREQQQEDEADLLWR